VTDGVSPSPGGRRCRIKENLAVRCVLSSGPTGLFDVLTYCRGVLVGRGEFFGVLQLHDVAVTDEIAFAGFNAQ